MAARSTARPVGTPTLQVDKIDFANMGDNVVIVHPGVGRSIRVFGLYLTCAGANNLIFKDGLGDAAMTLVTGQPFILPMGDNPWFVGDNDASFTINASAGTQVTGRIYYEVIGGPP